MPDPKLESTDAETKEATTTICNLFDKIYDNVCKKLQNKGSTNINLNIYSNALANLLAQQTYKAELIQHVTKQKKYFLMTIALATKNETLQKICLNSENNILSLFVPVLKNQMPLLTKSIQYALNQGVNINLDVITKNEAIAEDNKIDTILLKYFIKDANGAKRQLEQDYSKTPPPIDIIVKLEKFIDKFAKSSYSFLTLRLNDGKTIAEDIISKTTSTSLLQFVGQNIKDNSLLDDTTKNHYFKLLENKFKEMGFISQNDVVNVQNFLSRSRSINSLNLANSNALPPF